MANENEKKPDPPEDERLTEEELENVSGGLLMPPVIEPTLALPIKAALKEPGSFVALSKQIKTTLK